MSERTQSPFEAYENNGVPRPVAEVARAIALTLGQEGISSESQVYKQRGIIIMIDEGYQVTESLMNELTAAFQRTGVQIGFNEIEQIIHVHPTVH